MKQWLASLWQTARKKLQNVWFGKMDAQPASALTPEMMGLLTWQEAAELLEAKEDWLQAQKNFSFLALQQSQLEVACAYLDLCQKRYLSLLKEAKQAQKHASLCQCVWWALQEKSWLR